ncbi:multidrug resistance protein MDR [Cordyceps javanica]|uniref:Multidrug resistance protein MDR n=1 Tax=Cordyceps javanica TaxID=43265 RepID=A0A545UUV5_9HYPO|nr:multidrug resistance protein MDR [Cordyceps javanica]TQW05404.1 multidrug resistance protein MDR [Cordyceps javanica]
MGRISAGKSLLLKGILGDVAGISGEIAFEEGASFAYCSQTPWLENVSAEENWTRRGTAKNWNQLDKIARNYGLKDIQELHDYRTGAIGSQGVKLSGGQRQRLALARAATLERDVLLLDDVFSALNRRTKLRVAERLLRSRDDRNQSTVIFSTHDEHIANMADEVYEINQSGTLVRRPTTEPASEALSDDGDLSPEAKEEVATSETSQTSPSDTISPPSPDPRVKDMDVYKTYLRSMGLGNAVVFLLLGGLYGLDEDAQHRMEMLIESKFQDKTIISVCHKLPWALKSDRIIVLEKGEIIHDGATRDIVKESTLFAGASLPDIE